MKRVGLMDRVSLVLTLMLALVGIVFVHSSTHSVPGQSIMWLKQALYLATGMVIYTVLALSDYKRWVDRGNWLGILGILFLVAVLVWGHKVNGARSWFRFPMFSLQPSEFVKISTILWVTKYFSSLQERPSSLIEFSVSCLMIGVPVGLIVMQPDLGTALLYLPFFLIPNFLLGNKESIWVTCIGILFAGLIIGGVIFKPNWVFFLKSYQKDRIIAFIYPERDTSNSGYQVHQSKISIGQGGLFGMGIGKGKQTKLGFLPAQHNDFILAVVAEESGFLGMSALMVMFLVLFWRGLATAVEARDSMGSMLAALAIGTLALQTLFNGAMLTGLVPTTGIPCPLVSAGGSSMWTTCALLGLVQSVRAHRFVNH